MSPAAAPEIDADALLEHARRAKNGSYSPYSQFRVGAAVIDAAGRVHTGANVENASYGLTVCAERIAMFKAVNALGEAGAARGAGRGITALAVSCGDDPNLETSMRMPCGACRQVMTEFMAPTALVVVDGVGVFTLEQLMPQPFLIGADTVSGSTREPVKSDT